MQRINIEFKHEAKTVGSALGISEERARELSNLLEKEIERRNQRKNLNTSQTIELILTHVENPLEQAWLIYMLGRADELFNEQKMEVHRGY